MVETYLTDSLVIKGNPSLDEYRRTDQPTFEDIMAECWDDVLNDLIDMQMDVKKIYKRLSLQTSVTKTASFTGTLSDEDYAQRRRLLISSTQTGTAVFSLYGSDDDGVTNTLVDTYTLIESGSYNFRINMMYKKYRLDLISIGTTITYTADLVEDCFTDLHRDLTRSRIYEDLYSSSTDPVYKEKAEMMRSRYEQRLNTIKYSYDSDDSGNISEDEADEKITQTIKLMT